MVAKNQVTVENISGWQRTLLQRRQSTLCKSATTSTGSQTNVQVLLAAVKACSRTGNLEKGKQLHAEAIECGHDCNIYLTTALIHMYAKCGSMLDARDVFDGIKDRTVVSWTALILGYADNGQGSTAMHLFARMRTEGPAPDSVTFMSALKSCTSLTLEDSRAESRDSVKEIHNLVVENSYNLDVYVQNCLVDTYAKCGSMIDARDIFDCMKHPDVISWTALILGYAMNGQGHTALEVFSGMKTAPNYVTLVAALKACTSLAVTEGSGRWAEYRSRGKEIHSFAVQNGCNSNVYVQSSLVDMYAKCGNMGNAREVFDGMKHPTLVSWNVLILGYVDNGQASTALDTFTRMKNQGPAPDSVTLVAVLKACTSLVKEGWVECRTMGKGIHSFVVESGCNSDVFVQSTLVGMYAKCGSMVNAREVFDIMKHPTVVSWNVLILGYADNGKGDAALNMFITMKMEGPAPDSVTLVAALKACTCLAGRNGTDRGQAIHNIVVENGYNLDVCVQSTLIDMYAKCNSMVNAREVFDGMKNPPVVAWTALILGYANNRKGHTALELFTRMRIEGSEPDSVTFATAVKACGLVGALEYGREIHSELDNGNDLDTVLVGCLVGFYAKCGSLVEAQNVFDLHAEARNLRTWTALLTGFSSCGDIEAVFGVLKGMQDAGFRPDGVTFLSILTCCSRAGLVDKGKECFDAMLTDYGVTPTVDHYTCMIDLYGRSNKIEDAMALLDRMPCSPNSVTWMTILGACHKWKNVEIARVAFQSLIDLNDRDAAAYSLMRQIVGREEW